MPKLDISSKHVPAEADQYAQYRNISNSISKAVADSQILPHLTDDKSTKPTDDKPHYVHFQKTLETGTVTFWSLSMQEKTSAILTNVSVEPFILLTIIAFALSSIVSQNLLLIKFCLNHFNYTMEVCENLMSNKTLEEQVQSKATDFVMYKMLIGAIPTIIISLFLGAWSDKFGRKVVMIAPCIGGVLHILIMLLNVYYMTELQPEYLLIAEVPTGLTGTISSVMLGASSYLVDTTTPGTRTIRFAIMHAALMCGAPVGMVLGSTIFKNLGYYAVFGASGLAYAMAGLYVACRLQETVPDTNMSLGQKLCAFFDLQHIKDGIQTCTKKRENNHRLHIILTIIAMMLTMLPIFAEMNLAFYYVRLKFSWDYETYSYYTTAVLLSNMLGLMIIFPILTIRLKVSDLIIGIIGGTSKVCSEFIVAFSEKGWILFASTPIMLFTGLVSPIFRSMLTKCVAQNEQGKVMSVISAFDGGMPVLGTVIYTRVYNATLTVFPGTHYLISAVLCLIPVILFVWVSKDIRKRQAINEKEKVNSPEEPTEHIENANLRV